MLKIDGDVVVECEFTFAELVELQQILWVQLLVKTISPEDRDRVKALQNKIAGILDQVKGIFMED